MLDIKPQDSSSRNGRVVLIHGGPQGAWVIMGLSLEAAIFPPRVTWSLCLTRSARQLLQKFTDDISVIGRHVFPTRTECHPSRSLLDRIA